VSLASTPAAGLTRRPAQLDVSSPWLGAAAAIALGGAVGLAAAVGGAGIGILALIPIAMAILARPEWLPGALVISVFAEAYDIGGVSISRVAGPLALFVLLLQVRSRSPARLRGLDRPLALAIVAYSLWAVASVLWTVNLDPTTLQLGGTAFAVSSLLLSAVYLVVMAALVTNQGRLHVILVIVWALSAVTGLLAIAEYLQGSGRATGVAGDANFFASLQIVAIPIGAVLAAHARTVAIRTVLLAGVGIAVGSVFVSLSRGGILALATLVLLLSLQPARAFFRTRVRKRLFLGVVIVATGVLLTASYGELSERTSSLFKTGDGGSGRANLWLGARTGIAEHPVLGLGFGAFPSESNALMRKTPGVDFSAYRLRPTGQYVHNAYLGSLVELGPLGLALFLAMLGLTLRALRRAARIAATNGSLLISGVARALGISLVGFGLTSLFLSTETDRTLWVLMGLALTLPRIAAATSSATRAIPA